jgi:hypothetical protein
MIHKWVSVHCVDYKWYMTKQKYVLKMSAGSWEQNINPLEPSGYYIYHLL